MLVAFNGFLGPRAFFWTLCGSSWRPSVLAQCDEIPPQVITRNRKNEEMLRSHLKSASVRPVRQIAPPHGQAYFGTRRAMHKGQDDVPGACAASGRLKRKNAVR